MPSTMQAAPTAEPPNSRGKLTIGPDIEKNSGPPRDPASTPPIAPPKRPPVTSFKICRIKREDRENTRIHVWIDAPNHVPAAEPYAKTIGIRCQFTPLSLESM